MWYNQKTMEITIKEPINHTEKIIFGRRLALSCDPKPAAVWRLLGMTGDGDEGLRAIYESELAELRALGEPRALVQAMCGSDVPAARDRAVFAPGEEFLAVLLSAGAAGSRRVQELFAQGEHLRGLLADALLSAWVFAADEMLRGLLVDWCKENRRGISGRLEAPGDVPTGTMRLICEKMEGEARAGVFMSASGMLVPEKSMCYLLALDGHCGRFAAGPDCGRCGKRDCGMRRWKNGAGEGAPRERGCHGSDKKSVADKSRG